MASEARQPQERVTESGYVGIGAEAHDELEDLDLYEALINPHDQSGGGKDNGRGGPMMMPPMGMAGGGAAGSGGAGGMPAGIGANAMGAGAIGGMAGGKLPGAGMPGGGMPGGGTMPAGGGGLGSSFAGGGGGGGTMAAGVGSELGGGGSYVPSDFSGGGGGYTPSEYGGSDGGGYTPPDYSRDSNLQNPPDYDTGKKDPYTPGDWDTGDHGTTKPGDDPTDTDLPDFDKDKYTPPDYDTDLPDATTPPISDLPTGGGAFTPPSGIGGGIGGGGGGIGGGGLGGIDGLTGEPTAEEIQVSVAALRTEADIWEDLADEYKSIARKEAQLEIDTGTYGWINNCDASPKLSSAYFFLHRNVFHALALGETEFRAIAETLRTNADKYDDTESSNEQATTQVETATGSGPVPTGGGMHVQQAV